MDEGMGLKYWFEYTHINVHICIYAYTCYILVAICISKNIQLISPPYKPERRTPRKPTSCDDGVWGLRVKGGGVQKLGFRVGCPGPPLHGDKRGVRVLPYMEINGVSGSSPTWR